MRLEEIEKGEVSLEFVWNVQRERVGICAMKTNICVMDVHICIKSAYICVRKDNICAANHEYMHSKVY